MSDSMSNSTDFLEINEKTLPGILQMADAMPSGFFLVNAENREIVLKNKALIQLTGCKSSDEFDEYTKKAAKNLISEEDYNFINGQIEEITKKVLHEYYEIKFRIVKKNGELCWVKAYGNLIESELYGKVFYVFINDYTETIELEAAKKQADEANKVKTDFLLNMSHDIRTPMNAIVGFANLLEHKIGDVELCKKYVRKIQHSSNILMELINNVLEMTRIEKGNISLDEKRYHVIEFNDAIASVFELQMKEKGLEFERHFNIKHDYVWCDSVKVKQIFLNILANAYKYTNSGGKIIMRLLELPCERPGYAYYRTVVEDTGVGIAKEFLPHVFDSFSREQKKNTNNREGSGLGLSIVAEYVKLMGGTVDIESKLGVGTKVIVTLPHRIVTEQEAKISESINTIPETALKGKRILLAEDNDLNAEITIAILGEYGIVVNRARDGEECLDMMKIAAPDDYELILMDIQMPKMDGYEATRAIRQLNDPKKANIPIIAATANAYEEDKTKAMNAGMNGHVAKPINVNVLIKAMEAHTNWREIEE